MSLKNTLARFVLCLVLEVGVVLGIPINPKQIEELLQLMTRTRVEHVVRKQDEDPEKGLHRTFSDRGRL